MADQKVTDLTAASSAIPADKLYLVTNTSTTPQSKSISFDNLQKSFTDISLDTAQFDITMTGVTTEGQVAFDSNTGNLEYGAAGGFPIEIGKMTTLPRRAKNETGATLTKGTVVYINGVSGNDPTIQKAKADSDATSAFTIGVVGENINNNNKGQVVTFGLVQGINLSAFTAGQTVYLSGTTAGTFTSTKPSAPIHYVRVGIVTKATASGELFVNVINGYELDEIHDVSIVSKADKDVLQYESATGLWKNVPIGTVAGDYLKLDLSNTPLTGTTLNFNGTANKNVNVDRTTTAATAGRNLTIQSGGAVSGGANLAGGTLELKAGISTGSQGSDITIFTATPSIAGTTDRTPTQKMVIKGNGNVGINQTSPSYKLDVSGDGRFTGNLTAGNITGNAFGDNTGDNSQLFFGDGADSYVSFDGATLTNTYCTFDGSTTYTLKRDIYATDIFVASGYTVESAGYRIFSQGGVICDGTIRNNGKDASGTTAGAGATAGFFKGGLAGQTGLLAASAGAAGAAQTGIADNTFAGGVGGRGASGRNTVTSFLGGMLLTSAITIPANADGGARATSNIVNLLNRYINIGGTNKQLSPSIGGGAGAKSTTGTTATSGAGGGGGGVVMVMAQAITGTGSIEAKGGNGGNAAGTGGSFGGGGGGGGGILVLGTKYGSTITCATSADGGIGGSSITGTNGSQCVLTTNGNTTTMANPIVFTPTNPLTKNRIYMLGVHLQKTGGIGNCYVQYITGYGMTWSNITTVQFDTIASPTRILELWYGKFDEGNPNPDLVDTTDIRIYLGDTPTTGRVILDEMSNVDLGQSPTNGTSNSTDSALNLSVTLPSAPTSTNTVYSIFAKNNNVQPVVGSNNTLIYNPITSTPSTVSEVSTSTAQQTNSISHLTTNAAIGGISIEMSKNPSDASDGSNGWAGRVIRLYG